MIPFSLSWDTQKRSILLKWDGFLSLGWEKGKVLMKILRISDSLQPQKERIHFPMRWVYLKEAFSFLKKWRLKKMEGTFSLPDPMMNGLLYGWMSALETGKTDERSMSPSIFWERIGFQGKPSSL